MMGVFSNVFSGKDRTLVFVETKKGADFLATYLSQSEFPATSIHGYVLTNCFVQLLE